MELSPETIAAANGVAEDKAYGAVVPPLYLSSTYEFTGFDEHRGYDYSRATNPTRDQLSDTINRLEGGAGAVITSSGMAAIDLVLTVLKPDDLLIAPHDCYGGTLRLLSARAAQDHFRLALVDQTREETVVAALEERPALVLLETPSNPLMRITDIGMVSARARAVGAKVVVDNTFLSPALQRPIALGAHVVVHSTTKYLNGHSDVVGGAVVAADADMVEHFKAWANMTGVTGAPFDAFLTLRGLRTLFPRIEYQQRNATAVAEYLATHKMVDAVHYPGLPSHPGHAIAARQQRGFGAMLSFEIAGDPQGVRRFVERVRVFTLAESLGGVESLVAHPATMTHASLSPDALRAAGIGHNLLRLSVGLENQSDLISDLEGALAAMRT